MLIYILMAFCSTWLGRCHQNPSDWKIFAFYKRSPLQNAGSASSEHMKNWPVVIQSKMLKRWRGPWMVPTLQKVGVSPYSAVSWHSMQSAQTGVAEGFARVERKNMQKQNNILSMQHGTHERHDITRFVWISRFMWLRLFYTLSATNSGLHIRAFLQCDCSHMVFLCATGRSHFGSRPHAKVISNWEACVELHPCQICDSFPLRSLKSFGWKSSTSKQRYTIWRHVVALACLW